MHLPLQLIGKIFPDMLRKTTFMAEPEMSFSRHNPTQMAVCLPDKRKNRRILDARVRVLGLVATFNSQPVPRPAGRIRFIDCGRGFALDAAQTLR